MLAGLTAIASGLGGKAADRIAEGDTKLLSYGVEEQGSECGSITYLPAPRARATLDRPALEPELAVWDRFQHQPGAAFADKEIVQVSIQGESARKVTLTGIMFDVTRHERRRGATFSAPCGGGLIGRGIQVDVEASPPAILSSSRAVDGHVEAGGEPGSDTAPITFPWTVSVTDPLLLYVIATATSCDCLWTAEIPWVSGEEEGTIRIDNGGKGYRVVGSEGLAAYTSGGESWSQYRRAGETY